MSAGIDFSTGSCILPDIGSLSYNGAVFSSLFKTQVAGKHVYDESGWTVKYVEYTLTVEGFVTLPAAGGASIDNLMANLRGRLSIPGGELHYDLKGFGPFAVNVPGSFYRDVAWGPKPELLDFQPLGASRGALVRWQVKVCLPELARNRSNPVLQFNSEITIGYDEDGYSTLTIAGTLEIPLTRRSVLDRGMSTNVDDYRMAYVDNVIATMPDILTRFRVTRRTFKVSRDRRTMSWEYVLEEQPYMPPPAYAISARGQFSIRQMKINKMNFVTWICSLRCTYSVPKTVDKRMAWACFISLLRFRMQQSALGSIPDVATPDAAGPAPSTPPRGDGDAVSGFLSGLAAGFGGATVKAGLAGEATKPPVKDDRSAWCIGFEVDEGLYLDSRTVTFGATWLLICNQASILVASGLFRWKGDFENRNLWATNFRTIMGGRSWLMNKIPADGDVIVDFGR